MYQTLLTLLYWIILVLAVINYFSPSELYPKASIVIYLALFIIIGLKLFALGKGG